MSSDLLSLTILVCFGAFGLTYALTQLLLKLAVRYKIWDDPAKKPLRKKQSSPIPLLGGTGFLIVCTFLMSGVWLANKFDWFSVQGLLQYNLQPFKLIWVVLAIFLVGLVGYLDDRYELSAKWTGLGAIVAICMIVFLGEIKIDALSYPFDNILPTWSWLGSVLAGLWLLFCMASTKFLDGHDGLVSCVGIIGFLTIASVSMFENVNQPLIFLFSLIWVSGVLGFLPFNFPNAKMYLGEAGSEVIGLMLGVLSILSGAKIATAGTVVGWFIFDILFVWLLRILDKRNPITSADRFHWHFRLVDLGLNKIQVLVITVLILLITAHSGLFFSTRDKLLVLIAQPIFLMIIFLVTIYLGNRKKRKAAAET